MFKKLLFAAAILCYSNSFSQHDMSLEGEISAPDLQGSSVHIINVTQKTGTVNDAEGRFKILVKQGDTLLFSSIQYVNVKVEISKDLFGKGFLEISLTEDVNVLAEVSLSNTNLTGNLETDLENIELVKGLPFNLNLGDLQHLKFEADINDPKKAPQQLAFQQNQIGEGGTLNILGGIGLLANILGIKGKEKEKPYSGPVAPMSVQIRERFNDDFFKSSLGIQEEKIREFLFFLDDQQISEQLLNDTNQLALIDLLIIQSKKYKELYSID